MDTPIETPTSPGRRWTWWLLAILVVLLATDQFYRLSLHNRAAAELDALRKAGYPTDTFELQSWQRPVPDQQNAALRILEASDDLALGPKSFSQEGPLRSQKLGPQERDTLRTLLTENASALETLHAAARLTASIYPVDYSRGPSTLVPHLAKVKSLTQLLRAEATFATEEGRLDQAVQAVVGSLALARSLDREPLLVSQLVRMACIQISCSSLERVLTQQTLSAAQLSALQGAFNRARESSAAAFQNGFLGELCIGVYCFRLRPAELARDFDSDTDATALTKLAYPVYSWTGVKDRDFLFYSHSMREMIEASKLPFPDCLAKMNAVGLQTEHRLRSDKLVLLSRMLLPSLQRSADKAAETEGRLRCAQASLAVEQYRLGHNGLLPEQLASCASGTAGELPKDPIDGAPLRYRLLKPGYVVYSIGADSSDDGGLERTAGNRKNARARAAQEQEGEPHGSDRSGKGFDVTFTVDR